MISNVKTRNYKFVDLIKIYNFHIKSISIWHHIRRRFFHDDKRSYTINRKLKLLYYFVSILTTSNQKRTDHRLFYWVSYSGTYLPRFKFSIWHECSHFLKFILANNDVMLSVVRDVLVDSETYVVTLWSCVHRRRVCVHCKCLCYTV